MCGDALPCHARGAGPTGYPLPRARYGPLVLANGPRHLVAADEDDDVN